MPALGDRISDSFPTLATGWRWWISELAGLLPGGSRLPWSIQGRAEIRLMRDGVEIVRIARGQGERLIEDRPLEKFDGDQWQELTSLLADHRARILLAPPMCHLVTLRLPNIARSQIHGIIPLQLADHAPLALDQLAWTLVDVRSEGEVLVARIVLVRTQLLDAIASGFCGHGQVVPPVLAELPEGRTVPLPRSSVAITALSRPWLWAATILALAPMALRILLHLLVLRETTHIASLEEAARPRIVAERQIREQAETARALRAVLAYPSVTNLIEDLADGLPTSAHLLELAQRDGERLTMDMAAGDTAAARGAVEKIRHMAHPQISENASPPARTPTLHIEAQAR